MKIKSLILIVVTVTLVAGCSQFSTSPGGVSDTTSSGSSNSSGSQNSSDSGESSNSNEFESAGARGVEVLRTELTSNCSNLPTIELIEDLETYGPTGIRMYRVTAGGETVKFEVFKDTVGTGGTFVGAAYDEDYWKADAWGCPAPVAGN
jgi:hypothetical protein